MRKASNLFANVRPCRTYPGVRSRYQNVNVVVIRDVTEDLYAGVEVEAGTPEAAELIASIEKTTGRPIAPGAGSSSGSRSG